MAVELAVQFVATNGRGWPRNVAGEVDRFPIRALKRAEAGAMQLVWVEQPTWPFSAATCRRVERTDTFTVQ